MDTQLKQNCSNCKHHVGKKSIDDVANECFSCVHHMATLGYYPLWEPVEFDWTGHTDFSNKQEELEVTAEEEEVWKVTYTSDTSDWQAYDTPVFKATDNVNHPNHYKTGGIETIDYIKAKLGREGTINYCMGNVMKYTSRWQDKNGLEDLKKAQWYLNYAINLMED